MIGLKVVKDATRQVLANIRKIGNHEVYVGVPQSSTARDAEINNAGLMYLHEHGDPAQHLVPRPAVKIGIELCLQQVAAQLKQGAIATLADGDAMRKALEISGMVAQQSIQGVFGSALLKAKSRPQAGKTAPLIDTGQLRKSINYVIRSKD